MGLPRSRRHFLTLLTALMIGISLLAHGFAMAHGALKMSYAASAASTQAPPGEHGSDCAGKQGATLASCIAACASALAILSSDANVAPVATPNDRTDNAVRPFAGRGVPPEPHPPKRSV